MKRASPMYSDEAHFHHHRFPVYLPRHYQLKSNRFSEQLIDFTNSFFIYIFTLVRYIIIIPFQCLSTCFRYCANWSRTTNSFFFSTQTKTKNYSTCEYGSMKYFLFCGIAGMISCGLTHTTLVPLDLIKCRLQVKPQKYLSMFNGFRITIAEEGFFSLSKGLAPTLIGYSFQGFGKFGFYEIFKVFYMNLLSDEIAYAYRTWIYLFASASAELLADISLAPWEATKVRIQTQDNWASTLRRGLPKLYAEEGLWGFYKGLIPLWFRQIPYTMVKFACFERTVEALYKYVIPKPREQCNKSEQLAVTFIAGYIAGIFCAIVSHPPDTIFSKLNNEKGLHLFEAIRRIGFAGLWKGLGTRILMIGTLTALQWFIYETVKVLLGLPRPPSPQLPLNSNRKSSLTLDRRSLISQEFTLRT